MTAEDDLSRAEAMEDPYERAEILAEVLRNLGDLQRRASTLRDTAVIDLTTAGMPNVEVARLLGVTRARITQIRTAHENADAKSLESRP